MQTITKHYLDGAFVESHSLEVMDIIKPTNGKVIAGPGRSEKRRWTDGVAETVRARAILHPQGHRRRRRIRIANDTKYGLHAFVSGTDIQRARRVACRMLAGRVAINGMPDDSDAPWGGFKYSGIGHEFGRYGIEAFLEPRAILE
jgi:acyl-CoA reductase-like NAD-dependent aldehyde dehydrogenase